MNKLRTTVFFLILLAVIGLNIHLRLFPAYFPQLQEKARLDIENQTLRRANQFIQKQYPDFNPRLRRKLARQLTVQNKTRAVKIEAKVRQEYQRLRSYYQDSNNQTYLLEVDPYCRKRFTRLVLENGYPGNKRENGVVYDTFMLAPEGSQPPPERFLYYLSAYLYRAYSLVFPKVSLDAFLFYLPVFFSLVFFVVLYLFCRYFFSRISGVLAIIFIGLSPAFIHRSSAGWFDQDVPNILFPLLIVGFLSLGLSKKTFVGIVKYTLLASFLLGLYAFSWVGWWFIYAVIMIFFLSALFNNFCLHFKDKATLKSENFPYLVALPVFSAGSVIFCLLIAKLEPFSFLISALIDNLQLGKSLASSIWPSVLYTVSELRSATPSVIAKYSGGWVIFILSLLSLLGVYLREKRGKNANLILLLGYWTFVMFFASLKGVRFTQFLFVPLGIFLSIGLAEILSLFPVWLNKFQNLKLRRLVGIVVIFAIVSIISLPIRRGFSQAGSQYPLINDSWHSFMKQIEQKTPETSVMNSWWDYGNWFKEIAGRRTIVDPQIQNAAITYWMARVFLADNEEEALRILRMINNSSDSLFDKINSFFGDDFVSIAFLNKVLDSRIEEVDSIFKQHRIPSGLSKRIKDAIFLKIPDPAYLFIDKTMLYKMSAISFLGNWDFAKVYVLRHKDEPKHELVNKLGSIFNLTPEKADILYQEVMLSRFEDEINEVVSEKWTFPLNLAQGFENRGMVYFSNGIVLELDGSQARMFDPVAKRFKNLSFVFIYNGGKLIYKELTQAPKTSFKSGGFFFKSNGKWQCIGTSNKNLGRSLFSKLYFTKAKGFKYLEPFLADDQAGLYAFKINWRGK